MMIVILPLLALVAIVSIPVSLWTMRTVTRRSKKRFVEQWGHTGRLNALVEESFTGHAVVKAFGRQREVEERFRRTNAELYEASFGAQLISGVIQPSMMLLGNLNFVVIAVVGACGWRAVPSARDVQAFIQYSRQFSQPLTHVASMANVLQSGIASAERVFHLLDADEQVPDRPATPAPPARGRVAFEDVSFSYDPPAPPHHRALARRRARADGRHRRTDRCRQDDARHLLMRFYELDGGRIPSTEGTSPRLPRDELRGHMGMVLQDTWLFGGTILENIAYGNPGATEDQLLEAARATFVDRFVHSLPGRLRHPDRRRGRHRQRRREAAAHHRPGLRRNPTILILDEATSSVDTRTEVLIQRAMAALRSSRTSFVIAHRLSTIRDADVILVMDAGRIVEQGHHRELLAAGGAYATLYDAQFAAAATEVA
jgi:ATP-binding cassette subfamily B protein